MKKLDFRMNKGKWFDCLAGDIIYNKPYNIHTIRSYEQLFLCIFSWMKDVHCCLDIDVMDDWVLIEKQLPALKPIT